MKIPSQTFWRFLVRGPDGSVKSQSPATPNLNVLEGGINFLDTYLQTALNYTAAFYVGLCVGAMTPDYGDTAAKITTAVPNPPATNDWRETTAYSEAVRQLLIFGSVSAPPTVLVDNSLSVCVFTMTAAGVLEGGFMGTSFVKGGTGGKLYSVDSGAGSLAFGAGDTVEVTVSTGLQRGVG